MNTEQMIVSFAFKAAAKKYKLIDSVTLGGRMPTTSKHTVKSGYLENTGVISMLMRKAEQKMLISRSNQRFKANL